MERLNKKEVDKTYVLATGSDPMNKYISSLSYVNSLGSVKETQTLYDSLMFYEPEIVISTSNLKGQKDLLKSLLAAKEVLKDLRIILIMSKVRSSEELNDLYELCKKGVYDIYINRKIKPTDLENMIMKKKSEEEIKGELKRIEEGTYKDYSVFIQGSSQNLNKESEKPKRENRIGEPQKREEPIKGQEIKIQERVYEKSKDTLEDSHKEEDYKEYYKKENKEENIYEPYRESKEETYKTIEKAPETRGQEKIEEPLEEKVEEYYKNTKNEPEEYMTRDLLIGNKEVDEHLVKNLAIMSSIKPGTGKSFLSVNVATAIAAYGKKTAKGQRPKVALIEGDLQNLSIGTLLQIEDSKKNLKNVMKRIAEIVTKEGEFIGTPYQVEEINSYIKSSFLPYGKLKNLLCLVGSQLSFEEIEDIAPHYYTYLVEAIAPEFDVVIVDTNSALTHVTTYPLLQMAKNCFYILNLDFNNIRNNTRYRETLQNIGVLDKVKYILNEDLTKEIIKNQKEDLLYTSEHLAESGFNLVAKVPLIDKSIFLNRLYNGTPVVLDENNKDTALAKKELLKVANEIYPIEGFDSSKEKIKGNKETKKGFFRFGR